METHILRNDVIIYAWQRWRAR